MLAIAWLAPIYDNGASLGFQLKEDRIKKMFKDANMFKAFTNRSYSLIGIESKKKPKYLELLSEIWRQYPKEVDNAMTRLSILNKDNIVGVLNTIPASIMSDIYKEWVVKLLLYRKDWIKNCFPFALSTTTFGCSTQRWFEICT